MAFNAKNSKKQGDIGLGSAIAYFTSIGRTVLLPLTDSQDYDLAVDEDGVLKKVQVKTTSFVSKWGYYQISLSVKGGNRSFNTVKSFDNKSVDYLYVLTDKNERYLIPTSAFQAKGGIELSAKYKQFSV